MNQTETENIIKPPINVDERPTIVNEKKVEFLFFGCSLNERKTNKNREKRENI